MLAGNVEGTDEFDDPVDLFIAASNNGLTDAIIDAIKSAGDFAGGDVTATLLGVTSKLDFVVCTASVVGAKLASDHVLLTITILMGGGVTLRCDI
jgi:hypothetical protein